jgi:hypothetical protein
MASKTNRLDLFKQDYQAITKRLKEAKDEQAKKNSNDKEGELKVLTCWFPVKLWDNDRTLMN